LTVQSKTRRFTFFDGSKQNSSFYFLLQELHFAIVVTVFVLGSWSFFGTVVVPVFALLNTSEVGIGFIFYF
jgi:hypothetical protein